MDWRKSSRSGSASDCVELRRDMTAIRDSKHPQTELPTPALRALLTHLR
ncbi:DUF397 domain-containing protein [Actinokineospora fastidiosa]|uniref:DUF397 domain-containing protein n=1 Tax=Actinokineospora fastidiosa TaxID=1816 RepID=A0A918LEH0_9PSEU|nr:DUF397 domain-containing protein [Actinokineospora fastidiosa]GGS38396.1 hypothetical protein GCM10010171_36650 [Actinokineospora fastidiosa]